MHEREREFTVLIDAWRAGEDTDLVQLNKDLAAVVDSSGNVHDCVLLSEKSCSTPGVRYVILIALLSSEKAAMALGMELPNVAERHSLQTSTLELDDVSADIARIEIDRRLSAVSALREDAIVEKTDARGGPERLLDLVCFLVPPRSRQSVVGDLYEECDTMREAGLSERNIALWIIWQLLLILLMHTPKWWLGALVGWIAARMRGVE